MSSKFTNVVIIHIFSFVLLLKIEKFSLLLLPFVNFGSFQGLCYNVSINKANVNENNHDPRNNYYIYSSSINSSGEPFFSGRIWTKRQRKIPTIISIVFHRNNDISMLLWCCCCQRRYRKKNVIDLNDFIPIPVQYGRIIIFFFIFENIE
ncbi:hypothetical protein DERF_012054 [Dermatophagoides farinae]|uniref:Uncharacterized protein n=1 Tax=Dermatophagoides farinae TaxID=6954 RepID=A0A922HRU1_DERFA|nr:hypothetical protein DERF_012054 [Dermatophagoides farinae]